MNNQSDNPLLEYYPFHMPGHKQGRINPLGLDFYTLDTTETPISDDLFHPKAWIKESLENTKAYYKTHHTFYLVNGSTSGVLTAVCALTRPGDTIIMQRNSHHSVYHGVLLNQLEPAYLYPEIDLEYGISGGFDLSQLEACLIAYPKAPCVVITSPTYEGIVLDVKAIARLVHRYNKYLIVDEAHGAHSAYYPFVQPSALILGADVVIQSLHKTLPVPNAGALLHIKNPTVPMERMKRYYSVFQTSSPSFVLLKAIHAGLMYMQHEAQEQIEGYEKALKHLRAAFNDLEHFSLLSDSKGIQLGGVMVDPTRLTVLCHNGHGYAPYVTQVLMERYHMLFEMTMSRYFVGITSLADEVKAYKHLIESLSTFKTPKRQKNLDETFEKGCMFDMKFGIIKTIKACMTPGDAMAMDQEQVPLEASAGRVSGDFILLYPPSIPLVVPGEIITESMTKWLCQLMNSPLNLHGLSDGQVTVIKTGGTG